MKCGTTVSVYYSLHLQNAACPSEVLFIQVAGGAFLALKSGLHGARVGGGTVS